MNLLNGRAIFGTTGRHPEVGLTPLSSNHPNEIVYFGRQGFTCGTRTGSAGWDLDCGGLAHELHFTRRQGQGIQARQQHDEPAFDFQR